MFLKRRCCIFRKGVGLFVIFVVFGIGIVIDVVLFCCRLPLLSPF